MGPFGATKSVLSKYFTFSGRASRSEYWWWGLVYLVILAALTFQDILSITTRSEAGLAPVTSFWDLSYVIFALLMAMPNLSVLVRRLHDTDRSGWWFFISFVPFIGGLWLLVLMILPSTSGTNRFGPPPTSGHQALHDLDARMDHTPLDTGKTAITPKTVQASVGSPQAQQNAFRAYLNMDKMDQAQSEESIAARKAEMRAYYESRVLKPAKGA